VKRKLSLPLILLFLGFNALFGSTPYLQNESVISLFAPNETLVNESQIGVFRDDIQNKDIKGILALPKAEFLALNEINFFEKKKPYWATFSLSNNAEEPLDYVIEGGRNSKETYYFVDGEGQITTKGSGYHIPYNQRDIKQNYLNKVALHLDPGERIDIFVKIESLDNLPIDIQFKLVPKSSWERTQLNTNIFQGIFSGVLIIFILLSVFFYSSSKEQVFLRLGTYNLTTLLYFVHVHGYLEMFFFPDQADVLPPFWLMPLLIAASYYELARYFNNTAEYFPFWDKLFKNLSVATVVIFGIGSAYILLTQDAYRSVNGMYIVLFVYILLGLVFLFQIYQKGTLINRFFVFGSLIFIFSCLVSIAGQFFYLSNSLPMFVQFGLIVEVIVFSLGMAYRARKEYDEHNITQKSLILQLQQNDRLKENINSKLREEVVQRTQELRVKNAELIAAKNTAEKATASKSEFLSVMSHEIRTPLNAIISLSHIMEIDNEEKKIAEYIDALKFSAENLHSLINDVLDYNKIEAHKLRLEHVEFSLIDLLRNISEIFKYKAKRKGIELRIEIGEHTADRLIGDPTRLTQIFNNLLGNAIKFTKEGHVTLKVYMTGVKDEKAIIHFDVIDTGIGIPADKVELIFNEFEQANNSTTREFGGTGLGLSITKKLLELMGSEIHVDLDYDKGSKFSFEIPFVINKSFNIFSYGDIHAERDLNKASILVVDDNDMNRLVLNRLLSIWNSDFEEASGGQEAIDLCAEKKYDLILMDIEMRPIDAFEAFAKIKMELNPNVETPIIAMSAYQTEEFSQDINTTGFASFIHKPFDPDELYEKIIFQLTEPNTE